MEPLWKAKPFHLILLLSPFLDATMKEELPTRALDFHLHKMSHVIPALIFPQRYGSGEKYLANLHFTDVM